jgi:hypothetical protein
MVEPLKQRFAQQTALRVNPQSFEGALPRRDSIDLSVGERYASIGAAIDGLSRNPVHRVDELVVKNIFATDKVGGVALPPLPRRDPMLCEHVQSMIQRINQPLGGIEETKKFLGAMFASAAERVLNSYELELLEFAVTHKDRITLMYEPFTSYHAQESANSGEEHVVIGKMHHSERREYTPEEAFSTFLHELAHARESVYGLLDRRGPPQVILSEVHANAYGNGGKIGASISTTSRLYKPVFDELRRAMPGFDSLAPLDRYKYLSIMATTHAAPENALIYEEENLISAFPQLSQEIRSAVERAIARVGMAADINDE